MVSSMACLRAKIYGIKLPDNPRSDQVKNMIGELAKNSKI